MKLKIKDLLNQSAQKVKQKLNLESFTWGEYLSKLDEAMSGIWPSGTTTIIENGTYNIRELEYANVSVPQDPILQQITVTRQLFNGQDVEDFFQPYVEEGQSGFFVRRSDSGYDEKKVIAIYFYNGRVRGNGILRWYNTNSYSLCETSQSYIANIASGSIFEKVVTDGPHITT